MIPCADEYSLNLRSNTHLLSLRAGIGDSVLQTQNFLPASLTVNGWHTLEHFDSFQQLNPLKIRVAKENPAPTAKKYIFLFILFIIFRQSFKF